MLVRPTPPAVTVTAAELTELLDRITINPAQTVRRLKHWVRERVIGPIGARHPGTGKHRRYDFDTVTHAAVLTVLTDMHIPILGVQGLFAGAFAQAQAARRHWQRGDEIYFVAPAGRRAGGRLLQGEAFVFEGPWEGLQARLRKLHAIGSIILHLHEIFDVLAREETPRVR